MLTVIVPDRGVTLLEVMIASAIAAVIAIGLSMIEGLRARTTEEIRRQAGLMEPERKNAALAAVHLAKSLETADRFDGDAATGDVRQLRVPECPAGPITPACLDDPNNYEWRQYRMTGTELRLYRLRTGAVCPAPQVLAREITALTIRNAPVGSNIVDYVITWDNGPRDQTFQGRVITRFRPDTGIPLGLQNPALGDVSPPPALCP